MHHCNVLIKEQCGGRGGVWEIRGALLKEEEEGLEESIAVPVPKCTNEWNRGGLPFEDRRIGESFHSRLGYWIKLGV